MLEFTLVGIGMIFVLISTFEIARGMWIYHTLAYAVREGTRYAAMHGRGCASPHTCHASIGTIAGVIKTAGVGLDPNSVTATFTPAVGTATSGTITHLLTITTVYPPSAANAPGQIVKIAVLYPFRSILMMFWVGAGRALNDIRTLNMRASSSEAIQF